MMVRQQQERCSGGGGGGGGGAALPVLCNCWRRPVDTTWRGFGLAPVG